MALSVWRASKTGFLFFGELVSADAVEELGALDDPFRAKEPERVQPAFRQPVDFIDNTMYASGGIQLFSPVVVGKLREHAMSCTEHFAVARQRRHLGQMLFKVSVFCCDFNTDAFAPKELGLLNSVGVIQSDEPYVGFRFEFREHACKTHGEDCLSCRVRRGYDLRRDLSGKQSFRNGGFELSYLVAASISAVSELCKHSEDCLNNSIALQAFFPPVFSELRNFLPILRPLSERLPALAEFIVVECFHERFSVLVTFDVVGEHVERIPFLDCAFDRYCHVDGPG